MLYSVEEGKRIEFIPHEKDFRIWRSRLTDSEYQAIVDELNSRINKDEVHTSGWIPGSDWTGTVYKPIYSKACLGDETQAGLCFGLFLWVVMMERPEWWSCGHYEKDGIPIKSLTYFRVNPRD